jgi:hypothetical protein
MGSTRIGTLLIDTGLGPAELCGPSEVAALCGGTAYQVVRLERLLEQVLAAGNDDVAGEVVTRLRTRAHDGSAVAAKSIAAYRVGLRLSVARFSPRREHGRFNA